MIGKDELEKIIERGNIAHAYLTVGGSSSALSSLAELIARNLAISLFDRHDVIPEKGSITIGQIRQLRVRLSLKPHSSPRHLVVIPEGSLMTTEAQNALLKVLEEPAAPTIFLLAVPDVNAVLPTIASRCQLVHLGAPASVPTTEDVDFDTVQQLPLAEQFSTAERLAKRDDLPALFDQWLVALRARLRRADDVVPILQSLFAAKTQITATNANPRLILEEIFLASYGR